MTDKKTTKTMTKAKKSKSHTKAEGSEAARPFVPTQEQFERVYVCAQHGMSKEQVNLMIKDGNGKTISYPTFIKYFDDKFEEGLADTLGKVGSALLKTALQPKTGMHTVKAAEMFVKCKGKTPWAETGKLELTGKDGGAIETESTVTLDTTERVLDLLATAKKERIDSSEPEPSVDPE